jgi:hypothetical protein
LESRIMAADHLPLEDAAALEAALTRAASQSDSVEAFAEWLRAQPAVEAVATAPHLVKTEPPQREITARFRLRDGSTVTRTIDITVHPDRSLAFRRIHEP